MTSYATMARLVDALDGSATTAAGVVDWACPVPYFGRLGDASIATVGINPSDKEFIRDDGSPLAVSRSRLPTLVTLGIPSWSAADHRTLRTILDGCDEYFEGNPYGRWFGVLDRVLTAVDASYYAPGASACHLDIIPYATHQKWGVLKPSQRRALLNVGIGALAQLLRDSSINLLLLNGSSVAALFSPHLNELHESKMPVWDLPRQNGDVPGLAYMGWTDHIGDIDLGRRVRVLGWNHNLQSSFGVTTQVKQAIAEWLAEQQEVVK